MRGLPSIENEVPIQNQNGGLPGQKDGDLQKKEDVVLLGQKNKEPQENIDEGPEEVAHEGQTIVPLSPLSADNLTYNIAEDAMVQNAAPEVIKEEELSQDTKMTPLYTSDSDANVQAASGSETRNVSDQEVDGGVLFSGKNVKLPQERKIEELPGQKDEEPQENVATPLDEGQTTVPMSTLSSVDNLAYDSIDDEDEDAMVQIAVPEVMVEINEAEMLEETK